MMHEVREDDVVTPPIAFLVDVDNTLLDNDRFREDLRGHLAFAHGEAVRDRYCAIEEALFTELGYRDYLGAAQRLWTESGDPELLRIASYLLEYPFAELLYPGALGVLRRLRELGPTVVLTDGDAVFQPRKVERAGILAAVEGALAVYVHKERELDDVERHHPAGRYVLVDDKPRILAAAKRHWGDRVTTVLPRQGQFAIAPGARDARPGPDFVVDAIADLLELDLASFAAVP
jgi:FMN phosphatase YigB (HAD superfamily)